MEELVLKSTIKSHFGLVSLNRNYLESFNERLNTTYDSVPFVLYPKCRMISFCQVLLVYSLEGTPLKILTFAPFKTSMLDKMPWAGG